MLIRLSLEPARRGYQHLPDWTTVYVHADRDIEEPHDRYLHSVGGFIIHDRHAHEHGEPHECTNARSGRIYRGTMPTDHVDAAIAALREQYLSHDLTISPYSRRG